MNRTIGFVAALLSAVWLMDASHAQSGKPGVEKLYVLNCGEGTSSDVSRWSPGVDEGKSIDFVDALPRNPAGKVLKTELRTRYAAPSGTQSAYASTDRTRDG